MQTNNAVLGYSFSLIFSITVGNWQLGVCLYQKIINKHNLIEISTNVYCYVLITCNKTPEDWAMQ